MVTSSSIDTFNSINFFIFSAKLLRSDPVLKLCLQLENEQKLSQSDCIPTKLSWTKVFKKVFQLRRNIYLKNL